MQFLPNTNPPEDAAELRQRIYAGEVFLLPATDTTLTLVTQCQDILSQQYRVSAHDLPKLHDHMNAMDAMRELQTARRVLRETASSPATIREIFSQYNMADDIAHTVCDILRLRASLHGAQAVTDRAYTYKSHRDTWYANLQCQINWWLPLFDVTKAQTFTFLPSYFDRAVANSSGAFDYDSWAQRVGFQAAGQHNEADYPVPNIEPHDARADSFAAKAGEILIFSASHLHRTLPNESGFSRFSIDFRSVHQGDCQAGLGAPNVDNDARGDATHDYFPLVVM